MSRHAPTQVAPRLRQRVHGVNRWSASLVLLGVILPILAVLEPVQPLRALVAASLQLVLPGLTLARLLGVRDPALSVVVTVAASLALTVLTSTALLYAEIYSWQLVLILLGLFTAGVGGVTGVRGPR